MRFLLAVLSLLLLGGCAKSNGPVRLYFISSGRFTSGSRTGVGPGDTLATRIYVDANPTSTSSATSTSKNTLAQFLVQVQYSPLRTPFVYPFPLATFSYSSLPKDSPITYLDSTLTSRPTDFLYTSVFGTRTTSGSETWTFTATDKDGNMSVRSFTLAVRRADSTQVFHDYTLNLPAVANNVAARRFIDLRAGQAYPRYSVANPQVQQFVDLVLLPDGQRLASPDDPAVKLTTWAAPRHHTTFRLTTLTAITFTSTQDTTAIHQAFIDAGAAANTTLLDKLAFDQVYAFNALNPADKTRPYFGLIHVQNLPTGTTAGLQLQVRLAKQPR
ncbi:hypothetical protein [Hymenobacter psoromatis]|uniref:hypothetical protein n=1 Tax=Hymenobacter psoromatis TaxID=1484116 RepID=UPI001CBE2F3C|nr:hypothetical protein [Hymenobacter psoromatis]